MSSFQSKILQKIPGIRHGFGTRREPVPLWAFPEWETLRPRWKQVHGVALVNVVEKAQSCGEVDALATREVGLPIGVWTADCVPILLAREDGSQVAAVHAGWRGTRAQILKQCFGVLTDPGEWVACIGPSIGPCCYEVSSELASEFVTLFGKNATPGAPRFLDLQGVSAQQLSELGLRDIEVMRACTRCTRDGEDWRFESFRRDAGTARNGSLIQRA